VPAWLVLWFPPLDERLPFIEQGKDMPVAILGNQQPDVIKKEY